MGMPKPNDPLTPEEQALVEHMPIEIVKEILVHVIEQAITALSTQSNEHDAAARGAGFENAEHEVLAFLASDWFDQIVTLLIDDEERTPTDYVQAIIDQAYGEGVYTVVPSSGPILRRHGKKPRKGAARPVSYLPALSKTAEPGTELFEEYNRILEQEQARADFIVLEVPLFARCQREVSYA